MDHVVSAEDAEIKLTEIEDYFETKLDEENRSRILKAIIAGRLSFDEDAEIFNIILKSPIKLDNGDVISSLKLEQATVAQIERASRKGGDFEQMISIVSSISGQPISVIDRIKQRDILIIAAVLSFFG